MLIMVPFIVTAGPPGEMVVLAMEKAKGFAVKTWPAAVNTFVWAKGVGCGVVCVGKKIVEDPTTRIADEPSEIGVFDMVIALAPRRRLDPPTTIPDGFSTIRWPAIVMVAGVTGDLSRTPLSSSVGLLSDPASPNAL